MTHKKTIYHSILVLFLTSTSFWCFSKDPIEFEHINRDNGLPSNTVTAIVQDKYGMMWMSTFNGLVRFDGYNYKVFVHIPSDSNSLSDNLVNCLKLTHDGRVLVGHENHGFSIFDYKTEKFHRYKHSESIKNSLHSDRVFELHCDKNGVIWVGTLDGLGKFDTKSGRFSHFNIHDPKDKEGEEDFVSSIVEEQDGRLLLFVSGKKIARFNPASSTYEFLKVPELPYPKVRINRGGIIYKDKKGYIWIGTEYKGIVRFEEQTGQAQYYNTRNSELSTNVILHFMQDRSGKMWISTDGGGLMEYIYAANTFNIHRYDPKNASSVSSNAVYYVYEDLTGHLWVGTYAAGLNIIKQNKKRFELYTNDGNGQSSLSYKSVLAFADGGNGKVWIGTDGGGLNLFDPKKKAFEWFSKKKSGICSDIIKSLARDNAGNLWMGTYASGLGRVNFEKKQYTHFMPSEKPDSTTIARINVWALGKGKNDDVWIGELDAGVDHYDANTKTFKHYLYQDDADGTAKNGSVMALLVDKDENVWVGTETQGVHRLDAKDRSLTTFVNQPTETQSLCSNNVQTIIQDSEGYIWVGTKQGGLSKLINEAQKKFTTYTKAEGLSGNTVYGIVEDNNKNLWISTDNGISMLDRAKNKFHTFDKSDGLQSLEFTMNACYKDSDGFIYFGGTDGFNRFHPDSIHFNHHKPEVFISGFKLFNKTTETKNGSNRYFHKPIHMADTIYLSHSDYVFSLEFAAIDYTTPERNKFAYRLEGFEEDWNYVEASKRIATYTNLAPGTYRFHVRASNNDGLWNEQGRSIMIIVNPPWWQTWWFRSLAILLAASALIGFYYLRLSQIRERNVVLYKLVKQKTAELEGKNNELIQSNDTKDKLFSIIGHDLRNPVSALSTLTDMLQGNYAILGEKDKSHIVDHIQASANALKLLVNNLLDWALVQSKHLDPHPTIVETRKASEECFKLVKLSAHSKNIVLENHCAESHYVFVDPNMFHTILRNIVSNSIKFTPKDGRISIESTEIGNQNMLISITDTGTGMSQQKIDELLSDQKLVSTAGTANEKGSGLGLVVVKEFVEANKGHLSITSSPEKGTKFIIQLPMMQPFG